MFFGLFFRYFFHKCKTLHCLELAHSKNYIHLAKKYKIQNGGESACSKLLTEVCHQIFGGLDMQTM